uniref:Tr-type G domain-containing protein n=1 Tax=Ditylenchus dipsaci TaxID=166011 RepID=A0A915E1Z6_9BILA
MYSLEPPYKIRSIAELFSKMSRHRNIRNINIEDELEEDDDADYCGRSFEEDEYLSPGTSGFTYQRPTLTYSTQQSNGSQRLNDPSRLEEAAGGARFAEDDLFPIENVSRLQSITASKSKKGVPEASSANSNKPSSTIGDRKPPASALSPSIENLKLSEAKHPSRGSSNFQRLSALDIALASNTILKKRQRSEESKQSINLVVVGHVDAGKSTLMGHLLYLLGSVDDKVMHKHKQEATRAGKSSFAYAWILDEGEEERNRGVTMDIARASFETQRRNFNILDAPGHKDFIPNMITGASQADAALLVINSTRGEFETGFDLGGQTREHALLLRSLGVSKVIAAINKLDTTDWSQERFEEVSEILKNFLQKQAGFDNIEFVPLSGLLGVNVVQKPPKGHPLLCWYTGPTLLESLDNLPFQVNAKVETGFVENGDKLFIMPEANTVVVKMVSRDGTLSPVAAKGQQSTQAFFAGDQIMLTLAGSFEPDSIYPGHVLSRGGKDLLLPTQYFSARIVVFDVRMPILKGTRAELFAHSLRVPCVIVRLQSVINKVTREVIKQNPRVLTKNLSAVVEIRTDLPINIEPYSKCKPLSRFTLRANNETIAAGVVDRTL